MCKPQPYRKRPVVVQAMQWDGTATGATPIIDWMLYNDCCSSYYTPSETDKPFAVIQIPTLEGQITASPGDWVIRGTHGEFYPCKPEIFAGVYEATDSGAVPDNVQELWAIHLIGPDDILACESFEAAIEEAHDTNTFEAKYMASLPAGEREIHPRSYANVVPWDGNAERHAEALAERAEELDAWRALRAAREAANV